MAAGGSSGGRADVAVVGAGIIGLATARAIVRRHPRLRVVVLDKEHEVAAHQTGRSSGVIHSGIYYAPGSLKARMCVEGAAALRRYCDEREIPYDDCGKVIVATSDDEVPRLRELHRRAHENGAVGLELIDPGRLRELEPHVAGVLALHVPGTGVVDFVRVAQALAADVEGAGGEIRLGCEVTRIGASGAGVRLETREGAVEAGYAIACAGVHADRLARAGGGAAEPRIVPFRGDYLVLRADRRHLVNGLVYPVPDPSFPFLGVHTTVRPDGAVWLGPNAVLAFAREGYGRFTVRPRDLAETLASPGFRRLALRHWRTGFGELARDYSTRLFVGAARKLLPELEAADVQPGPSGIRAQALGRDGSLLDDFVFDGDGRVLHVRNAPSPGATSCLAIAESIADMADETFALGDGT